MKSKKVYKPEIYRDSNGLYCLKVNNKIIKRNSNLMIIDQLYLKNGGK